MLKLRHEQAKIEVDYENSSAEELYVLGISFLYDGRFILQSDRPRYRSGMVKGLSLKWISRLSNRFAGIDQ